MLLRILASALDRRLWTFSSTGVSMLVVAVGVRAETDLAGVDVIIGWETVVVGLGMELASKATWALLRGNEADFYKRTNQHTSHTTHIVGKF